MKDAIVKLAFSSFNDSYFLSLSSLLLFLRTIRLSDSLTFFDLQNGGYSWYTFSATLVFAAFSCFIESRIGSLNQHLPPPDTEELTGCKGQAGLASSFLLCLWVLSFLPFPPFPCFLDPLFAFLWLTGFLITFTCLHYT